MPYTPTQHQRRLKRYRLERARGIQHRVPSQPARDHVTALLATGMTRTAIARAAGYRDGSTLATFLRRDVIHRDTLARILAVTSTHPPLPGAAYRVPATGPTRRLRALAAIGWTLPDLTARTGIPLSTLRAIREGRHAAVLSPIAEQVTRVFDELAMTPGTDRSARAAAARHGWAPPLAWPEGGLDDPDARPDGIRPATTRAHTPMVDVLDDFHDTWPEHRGHVTAAAARLNLQPATLARTLARARAAGIDVTYLDDTKPLRAAA